MKVMTMADVRRLSVDGAPKTTHLARFEHANDVGAKKVFDVTCPECGAPGAPRRAWCLEN
jgi:uncharacterized OB-fold protein